MTYLAKKVLLKRLNKMQITNDGERLLETRTLKEANNHDKRHLDRSHDRILTRDSFEGILNFLNDQELNSHLSLEVILLGLKANDHSFKEKAKILISTHYQLDNLLRIYKALAEVDYKFAVKVFIQNSSHYIDSTKKKINEIIDSLEN